MCGVWNASSQNQAPLPHDTMYTGRSRLPSGTSIPRGTSTLISMSSIDEHPFRRKVPSGRRDLLIVRRERLSGKRYSPQPCRRRLPSPIHERRFQPIDDGSVIVQPMQLARQCAKTVLLATVKHQLCGALGSSRKYLHPQTPLPLGEGRVRAVNMLKLFPGRSLAVV